MDENMQSELIRLKGTVYVLREKVQSIMLSLDELHSNINLLLPHKEPEPGPRVYDVNEVRAWTRS